MFPRILIVALCFTLVSCKNLVEKYKRSNSGLSSQDKKLLYDFRQPVTPPLIDLAAAPKDLLALSSCTPKIQRVDGSFTYAAENESAYLWQCSDSKKIFVFAGAKLQASSDTSYSAIAGTFDLNRDDKNELLLIGETNRNGAFSREASLQTFEKNTLHAVEDFGIVYHDTCALFAGADEAKKKGLIAKGLTPYVEAVVIYYLPHSAREMPSFTAERYRAPCPDPHASPANWQLVTR
jgi:hypothetical protein